MRYTLIALVLLLFCSCAMTDLNDVRHIHIGDSKTKVVDVIGYPQTEMCGKTSEMWCYYIYEDIMWSFRKTNFCIQFKNNKVVNKLSNPHTNLNANYEASYGNVDLDD